MLSVFLCPLFDALTPFASVKNNPLLPLPHINSTAFSEKLLVLLIIDPSFEIRIGREPVWSGTYMTTIKRDTDHERRMNSSAGAGTTYFYKLSWPVTFFTCQILHLINYYAAAITMFTVTTFNIIC